MKYLYFSSITGIFPQKYSETDRVSMFTGREVYGDTVEQKSLPVL